LSSNTRYHRAVRCLRLFTSMIGDVFSSGSRAPTCGGALMEPTFLDIFCLWSGDARRLNLLNSLAANDHARDLARSAGVFCVDVAFASLGFGAGAVPGTEDGEGATDGRRAIAAATPPFAAFAGAVGQQPSTAAVRQASNLFILSPRKHSDRARACTCS
jgi:hypothetical protein